MHLLQIFRGDRAHKADPISILLPIIFQKFAAIFKRVSVVHDHFWHAVQNPIAHVLHKVDSILLSHLLHGVIISHVNQHSRVNFPHSFIAEHKEHVEGTSLQLFQFAQLAPLALILHSLNETRNYFVVFGSHLRIYAILKEQKHGKVR